MALTAKTRARRDAAEAGTVPRRDEAYKARVFLLALLGYLYIFGILALALGMIGLLVALLVRYHRGGAVVLKLVLPLGSLTFVIVRSLLVRIAPPTGRPLTRDDAASLHAAINEVRGVLRAPVVHEILLTGDFNAAIAQLPRLGPFGFHRNYLLVGLPLLQALSPEQFRAVLAHELGHLSNADGRFEAWIYRMRATWMRLLGRLQADEHWGQQIFLPFFSWYAPFFGTYTFALARAQEYAADRAAASVAGARQMADALLTLELRGNFLDQRYWPELFRNVNQQAQPPLPFQALPGALHADAATVDAGERLAAILRRETDPAATHPALRDRLAILGEEARVPPHPERTAAEWLFGAAHQRIAADLDREWQQRVGPAWKERHDEASRALAELRQLDQLSEQRALTAEEALQRARLTEEFGDEGLALGRYREALERAPASHDAQFATGRLLLAAGDEAGVALLDRAMDGDWEYVLPGCEMIIDYLEERDREGEAEPYQRRALAQHELLVAAGAEREGITRRDAFLPHGMAEGEVVVIAGHLTAFPQVTAAHLARKVVRHFEDRPVYVLGVAIKQPWYRRRSPKADEKLAHAIARSIEHPDIFYVVPLNRANQWLRKPLQAVPGATIYRRG